MIDDAELLRRYSDDGSEPAFTEFVGRHLGLVYFSALRRTGNAAVAQDVAQCVFTTVARKAARLSRHLSLTGWLYTTTRHLADRSMRKERTRQRYEQEAAMHEMISNEPSQAWERLKPIIDEILEGLVERDREAILLRFFEGLPFPDMGAVLRISPDAARMRVDRALEKLRAKLARRGIQSPSAAVAVALSTQTGIALPAGMVATVSGAAVATATATGGAAVFVGIMSATKTAVVAATIATVLATGFGIVQRNRAQRTETVLATSIRDQISLRARLARAEKQSSQAEIRATKADKDIAADARSSERHDASASKPATGNPQKPLDPAYVAKMKRDAAVTQMKSNFGDFLTGAQLTAAEATQLLDLLAEERQAALDLIVGARDRGIYWGASPDLEAVVLAAATSEDMKIAALLGPERFAQFEEFRATAMIRMTLIDLNDRLVDQGEPLTDDQTRKLIQTFSSKESPTSARRAPIKAVIQVIGMPVTDEMLETAKSVLSPSQLPVLRSLQIAQQKPERSTIGSATPSGGH